MSNGNTNRYSMYVGLTKKRFDSVRQCKCFIAADMREGTHVIYRGLEPIGTFAYNPDTKRVIKLDRKKR